MFAFLSFALYGYKEFTSAGFQRNKEGKDFADASVAYGEGKGRVEGQDRKRFLNCIVTGMNSGLGRQTVLSLVSLDGLSLGKVYLVCRNAKAGAVVLDEMNKIVDEKIAAATSTGTADSAYKKPELLLRTVDLSRPGQVVDFVKSLPADEPIDILINNAGALIVDRQVTPDGIEASFALNTLGTFSLTESLIPLLKKSQDARVVTVSSGGMYNASISTLDLESQKHYDGTLAYAQQKRAQVELSNYWAKMYPLSTCNISFYSMHPGWTKTPGLDKSLPSFSQMMNSSLRTVQEGCDTTLFAALTKSKLPSGSFLFDRKVVPQHLYFGGTDLGAAKTDTIVKELVSTLQAYLRRFV